MGSNFYSFLSRGYTWTEDGHAFWSANPPSTSTSEISQEPYGDNTVYVLGVPIPSNRFDIEELEEMVYHNPRCISCKIKFLETLTSDLHLRQNSSPLQQGAGPDNEFMRIYSIGQECQCAAGNGESLQRSVRRRVDVNYHQDSPSAGMTLFGTNVMNDHAESLNQPYVGSLQNQYSSGLSPVAASAASSASALAPLVHVPSNSNSNAMQHNQGYQITTSSSVSVSSVSHATTGSGSRALQSVSGDSFENPIIIFDNETVNSEPNASDSPSVFASSSRTGSRVNRRPSDPGLRPENMLRAAQNGTIASGNLLASPSVFLEHDATELTRIASQAPPRRFTWRDVRAAQREEPLVLIRLLTPGLLMTRAQIEAAIAIGTVDNSHGIPFYSRAALAYEARRIQELIQLSNNLDYEDNMVIDESMLYLPPFQMEPELHDDMPLEIDDMSYEELLALEEEIGNVSTGLTPEAILSGLKPYKYKPLRSGEKEICCICLDEYVKGHQLGKLNCVHKFHFDCIEVWLLEKNWCPICKQTALGDDGDGK